MALISRQLSPNRSFALDAFRGLTLAAMILVSNPGGPHSYPALEHAAWDGWTPTDLIFPSFAFIIGVALVYTVSSRRVSTAWRGLSLFDWITPILLAVKWATMLFAPTPPTISYDLFLGTLLVLLIALPQLERVAARHGGSPSLEVIHHGFLLFALGFTWNFDASNPAGFRIFGVLQRLGIIYLFAGLIVLHFKRAGQIGCAVLLLAAYSALMVSVQVPGYGAGVLTITGNLAGYVDQIVIGGRHMYLQDPFWDPEGILGSLPAIASGLLGAIAGGWLRRDNFKFKPLLDMMAAGALLIVAGLFLDAWFPINKNLWSPSYVMLVGGVDVIGLGAMLWLVDFKHFKKPFLPVIVLGSNSILIYLLSGTIRHYLGELGIWESVYHALIRWQLKPYRASLAMALVYVGIWTAIAAVCYRKKIFVKI
jgi:predicted acyltransferase